jgi:maleylacetoacetate isomerase
MATEPGKRPVLYGYWRSSSSYRVRIALNLKNLAFENKAVHLVRDGGEQHQAAYRKINPLGLVPALVHNGVTVVQSMTICEYLEETFAGPSLLPADAAARARVRGIAQSIASEIQPMNNVGVMNYLKDAMSQSGIGVNAWYRHWIARGFSAIETWLDGSTDTGECCHGDSPGLADCFLVPQVYNAERFSCDMTPYPTINRIVAACRGLSAFQAAAPENQPDAGRV